MNSTATHTTTTAPFIGPTMDGQPRWVGTCSCGWTCYPQGSVELAELATVVHHQHVARTVEATRLATGPLRATGCPWPTGLHKWTNGTCTRCGATVGTEQPSTCTTCTVTTPGEACMGCGTVQPLYRLGVQA